MRHNRISKLQDRKSQLEGKEWENVLSSVLLQDYNLARASDQNEKVEAIASIIDSQLSISFRKNISGITQRLGEILLSENQDLELDTVRWTSIAVRRSMSLEQSIQDLTLKYESANQTIEKLNSQLDDLVAAKRDHEEALLIKFKDLLNNKKLKIRDQQRLLASAKVNTGRAEDVQKTRGRLKSSKPEQTRPGKRKAAEDEGPQTSDEDEEDGFEPVAKEADAVSDKPVTSDSSDTGGNEASEEDEPQGQETGIEASEDTDMKSPPPVRELPFSSGNDTGNHASHSAEWKAKPLQQRKGDDEDDETTDDEL